MKKINVKVYTNGTKKAIITVYACNGFSVIEADCYKDAEFVVRLRGTDLFDDRAFSQIVDKTINKALEFIYADNFCVNI